MKCRKLVINLARSSLNHVLIHFNDNSESGLRQILLLNPNFRSHKASYASIFDSQSITDLHLDAIRVGIAYVKNSIICKLKIQETCIESLGKDCCSCIDGRSTKLNFYVLSQKFPVLIMQHILVSFFFSYVTDGRVLHINQYPIESGR